MKVYLRNSLVIGCVLHLLFAFAACNYNSDVPSTQGSDPVITTVPEETESPIYTNPHNSKFKTYSIEGMQIDLPPGFKQVVGDVGIGFESTYSIILVEREPFTDHPSLPGCTLEKYGQLLIDYRCIDSKLEMTDGILNFDYEVLISEGIYYHYFVTLYKTETDFWIIEYICDLREADRHRPEFLQWAKSVKFIEE